MFARIILMSLVAVLIHAYPGNAAGTEDMKQYFSDAAAKVKAASDPAQKREILGKSLKTMSKALDKAKSSPLVSSGDRAGIARFQAALQDKQDELDGKNGYTRIADSQLNAFSDYVVQDMEQAQQTITISVVTLLLILIIVLLLAA